MRRIDRAMGGMGIQYRRVFHSVLDGALERRRGRTLYSGLSDRDAVL